jgi:hypothetical protein
MRNKSKKKNQPSNINLYNKVKEEAKQKFKRWPSAYASGWLVKEYKRKGGKYTGKKPLKSQGLGRWFQENWINVCKLPKKVSCGQPKINYQYCTLWGPYGTKSSKKITRKTPRLAKELSKQEIKRRCSIKKKN